ncbi:phytoene desaturase family protein [Paenibacillus aurantiacus]|uniref:4,4'-diaponeurosporene oxygenase n=1 Tax=Paenibacillus aurantiacus TaxID=1936118 RepID=A0ABV5KX50_9BACL
MSDIAKKVIVIGGGIGGLAAAIRLRADGREVVVLEKNERAGGKLNIRAGQGFTFDTGPSSLTMPWVLERLFASAGRRLSDYVTLSRVEPQWRVLYEDGTELDLSGDLARMLDAIGAVSPRDRKRLLPYLEHARKLYDMSLKSFYKHSLSGAPDLRQLHSLKERIALDSRKTVAQTTAHYFQDPRIRQLFDLFSVQTGSSPMAAPALLSQLAFMQLGLGLYYVEGGMYNIARAMLALLDELGVEIRTNAEVESIVVDRGAAVGVRVRGGEFMLADAIVCNREAIPAYATLLADHPRRDDAVRKLARYAPSASAHILLLGVGRSYPNLRHHNYFMSEDPAREYRRIFHEKLPAEDPTVYVGISSKTDPTQAPEGKENWVVVTHVPPIGEGESWSYRRDYYRDLVLDKLERMGASGLRAAIEFEYDFIPDDLQALYGATGGSLYGVAADRKRNGGFKIPARSAIVDKLYFVGGATHPGGGIPMTALGGQMTADLIRNDFAAQAVISM